MPPFPPSTTRRKTRHHAGLPFLFLLWLILLVGSVLFGLTYMFTTLRLSTSPSSHPLPPRAPLDAAGLELFAAAQKQDQRATTTSSTSAFLEAMKAYPWDALEEAIAQENQEVVDHHAQEMLYLLTPFLLQPPSIDDDSNDNKKMIKNQATAAAAATTTKSVASSLADALVSWAVSSLPSLPASAYCPNPPPLPDPSNLECSAYPEAFSGTLRTTPAKVGHVLQFAFDADTLEVLLHELKGVVDRVFLLESTKTHNKALSKPLLWDDLKRQERFAPFLDMVVHMVLDDVQSFVPLSVNASEAEKRWALESHQEVRRWGMFVQWNEQQGGYFGPEDLVGFGDVDNIPSRLNVFMLKHCELAFVDEEKEGEEGEEKEEARRRKRIDAVDIGTWMAWGTLTRAYKPDHSLPHKSFSYCDPTFWRVEAGMALTTTTGAAPNRLRGKAGHFLLGGVHMSDNPYVPFLLAKTIACSECAEAFKAKVPYYREYLSGEEATLDNLRKFEQGLNRYSPKSQDRFLNLETVKDAQLKGLYHMPWFVECFPSRFPGWFGQPDARLRLEEL